MANRRRDLCKSFLDMVEQDKKLTEKIEALMVMPHDKRKFSNPMKRTVYARHCEQYEKLMPLLEELNLRINKLPTISFLERGSKEYNAAMYKHRKEKFRKEQLAKLEKLKTADPEKAAEFAATLAPKKLGRPRTVQESKIQAERRARRTKRLEQLRQERATKQQEKNDV